MKDILETRSDQTIVRDLLELVAALDRRMPMLGREGEREIARDAQGLRRMALKRIAELDRTVFVPAVGVARQDGNSGETI